jgi:hypothetical protein
LIATEAESRKSRNIINAVILEVEHRVRTT